MKKRNFKTLALMGLTSGLCITSHASSTYATETPVKTSGVLLAAQSCGQKCGAPHNKCGSHSCSSLSDKCGAHSCSSLSDKCGAHSCSSLTADSEAPESSKIPYTSPKDDKNSKDESNSKDQSYDPNDGNLGYHLMTEQELLLELNADGIRMYKSLDAEGKALALKTASARCNGTNECRNLNACKTDKNDCAGKGACKGQGKCAVADKNLAVKLVYQKMQAKRNNALK